METRIRFTRGGQLVIGYHGVYWEYFRLVGGGERHDVHSFNPRRDGWGLGFLKRLLRRHGIAHPSGTARLECEKQFLLGCGEVSDAVDLPADDGGSFGYLATGPGREPSRARLVLRGPNEEVVLGSSPLPEDAALVGSSRWVGSAGWSTGEVFSMAPAGSAVTFNAQSGYNEFELSQATRSPREFLI